jgi:hypothetical protein
MSRARDGFERSDLPALPAALAIGGVLSLIAVAALVAWALAASFGQRHPVTRPDAFQQAAAQPASPRLEADPSADRMAIDAAAQAHLTGYGWSDRQAGLAHVPIDRAMALLVQQGWPDADTGPTNAVSASVPPTNAALTNAAVTNTTAAPDASPQDAVR